MKEGDIIGGRYELTELMAVLDPERGWVCPRCDKDTNSYGHHRCTARDAGQVADDMEADQRAARDGYNPNR